MCRQYIKVLLKRSLIVKAKITGNYITKVSIVVYLNLLKES